MLTELSIWCFYFVVLGHISCRIFSSNESAQSMLASLYMNYFSAAFYISVGTETIHLLQANRLALSKTIIMWFDPVSIEKESVVKKALRRKSAVLQSNLTVTSDEYRSMYLGSEVCFRLFDHLPMVVRVKVYWHHWPFLQHAIKNIHSLNIATWLMVRSIAYRNISEQI